jgi:hypothetical protein
MGVEPDALDLSPESIAQSHWSTQHENGDLPIMERIEAVAACKANDAHHEEVDAAAATGATNGAATNKAAARAAADAVGKAAPSQDAAQ